MTKRSIGRGGVARWKVIYDQLRAELEQFDYGSDFYTAREICQRFGVSSITAVRSLNELAGEGLIEKIQGKGNVVRQVPRRASLWMILPTSHESIGFPFDNVHARRMDGIREAGRAQGIEIGTICESHLQTMFPRRSEEQFGFFVLNPIQQTDTEFLATHQLPYVLVDPYRNFAGQPHARLDRFQVGYQAAQHLIELGHRRIGWITTGSQGANFRERIAGYRSALSEAAVAFDDNLIVQAVDPNDGSINETTCSNALDTLLQLPNPPTAMIICDDTRVIHLLDICRRRGIHVPDHLSVLGHPDYSESTLTDPPLTVIDGQYEKVGEAAVHALLDQIFQGADPASQARTIMPRLVPRSSTRALERVQAP